MDELIQVRLYDDPSENTAKVVRESDAVDKMVGWIDADPGDETIDEVVYGLNR